ncbi:uncharacterized protein LOC117210733 [Bombus bifarius]|uniref:Uncharacterized protein LOC117210733 n=1 Tax=Bombus bifarius TaxID=103933 RepID=A0A6P8N5L2_9HYME|nr:uncharacterized protein LOC117157810 [Bombus vancouverensis nearcticus]XP_033309920.1 uncharacterized protein LOC117210733 [Bombus bifarius]XP_050486083.1 uncharacterized protein LOC126871380 [Bombus huntii]
MKLFCPSNIYQESWLLLSITKLLGLYPIKFFRIAFPNYLYVSILVALYWFCHWQFLYYIFDMFDKFRSINDTFLLRYVRVYLNILSYPIIIISSMYKCSKVKEVFELLDTVDESAMFLNIEIDHSLCMKNDIVRITTAIFVVLTCNLMDYYGLLDNDSDFIYLLIWVIDRLPDFVCVIVICSFTVFMYKIEIRFMQINTILNIITKGKHFISISEMSDMNNVSRYRLLKWLRFELHKTMLLLNEAYSFRFKLMTIIYIGYICLHVCIIYNHTFNTFYAPDVILSFTWSTTDLIKLVYLIHLYGNLTLEHN